jgi:hypothetical protein
VPGDGSPWLETSSHGTALISNWQASAEEGALPRTGEHLAWFGGLAGVVEQLTQRVTIPEGAVSLELSGYVAYGSAVPETGAGDFMRIGLVDGDAAAVEFVEWNAREANLAGMSVFPRARSTTPWRW